MTAASLGELLATQFSEGLESLPLAEVRSRRASATEVETSLSYLRRLVQGRLDIVLAEHARREAGLAPEDAGELVKRLPEILGDHVHAPGLGRLPTLMAPGDLDPALTGRLDSIIDPARLCELPRLSDEQLQGVESKLYDLEREVSGQRRALHEVLDRLQGEIVRRYQSGEASVDSLLGESGGSSHP
jgi:hypothetical protein